MRLWRRKGRQRRRSRSSLALGDGHRVERVALPDAVDDVHPARHAPEDRVLAVEVRLGLERDEELAPVRVGARVRHREDAALVAVRVPLRLVLEPVAWAASAGARRVAALEHEVGDDAVENRAVVEVVVREEDEVVNGLGRVGRVELDLDVALGGGDRGLVALARVDLHGGRGVVLLHGVGWRGRGEASGARSRQRRGSGVDEPELFEDRGFVRHAPALDAQAVFPAAHLDRRGLESAARGRVALELAGVGAAGVVAEDDPVVGGVHLHDLEVEVGERAPEVSEEGLDAVAGAGVVAGVVIDEARREDVVQRVQVAGGDGVAPALLLVEVGLAVAHERRREG